MQRGVTLARDGDEAATEGAHVADVALADVDAPFCAAVSVSVPVADRTSVSCGPVPIAAVSGSRAETRAAERRAAQITVTAAVVVARPGLLFPGHHAPDAGPVSIGHGSIEGPVDQALRDVVHRF